jgi:hypothetical protein
MTGSDSDIDFFKLLPSPSLKLWNFESVQTKLNFCSHLSKVPKAKLKVNKVHCNWTKLNENKVSWNIISFVKYHFLLTISTHLWSLKTELSMTIFSSNSISSLGRSAAMNALTVTEMSSGSCVSANAVWTTYNLSSRYNKGVLNNSTICQLVPTKTGTLSGSCLLCWSKNLA